jgi:hypothetical protein
LFYVWDSGSPALNASASRRVVLSKACPDAAAPYLCSGQSGQYCSGARPSRGPQALRLSPCKVQASSWLGSACIAALATQPPLPVVWLAALRFATHLPTTPAPHPTPVGTPCEQAAKLLPPAVPQPRLVLTPSGGTVYLPYGRRSPLYLGACGNRTANATCGAVAWLDRGNGSVTDLSSSIVVQDISACASGSAVSPGDAGRGKVGGRRPLPSAALRSRRL